jgi:peptidoglycan/xylan/chitin deacetylase (PgdA/CDA1 family)
LKTGVPCEVAVLAYHRVGPPPVGSWDTWYSVPEETFVSQIGWLIAEGWEPIGVRPFVAALRDGSDLPSRTALITFDDAFKSLTGTALGCLRRLGCPAVVFVPVGHVGGTNRWDANTAEPSEPVCDWDDLRKLEAQGVSVQSHAHSHRSFSILTASERAWELEASKVRIDTELGKQVELLAYPYGDAGPSADESAAVVARAGYQAAFLYGGSSFLLLRGDRFRLPRIAMGPDTELDRELATTR